ncbi:electron transfer flavoprotein beta subunit lysine methyltransferase-like [Amphiura filiformis]|uniref:electron transfer flavoprotein beta subunit lysine methyltransferase-like n=1 Tax=Amphiura filiformis TaxID=82378 RepID=UPI003B217A3D
MKFRIYHLHRSYMMHRWLMPLPKHSSYRYLCMNSPKHSLSTLRNHHHHDHATRFMQPQLKKLSHITWCKPLTSDAAINAKDWERFIKDNTEVSLDHLTPEITLRLITPRCHLWSVPYSECEDAGVTDPYWAFYWPGGQALTRFLLDNPDFVRGKSVLDIGSGCGASAIGCKVAGAYRVMANDIDPVSIQAIKMNAALNHVTLETSTENFIGRHISDWDVILLGDMFYDNDFTNMVSDWLKYLSSFNTTVLIGDPGRFYLQSHPIKKQLTKVFEVELPEQSRLENNGLTQGFVWQLVKEKNL